jgi:hypothetical protein
VGGSNFGELLGALSVLVLSDVITTPMPWLRLDALALNIVWVLPTFAVVAKKDVSWAWRVAGSFIPISFGWAAGDVSLAAYIQSTLTESNITHYNVSPLGAVMAFLYVTYIVINAILSVVLGNRFDREWTSNGTIVQTLKMVGGVHFTVACVVIFLSTFIPKGAFAFNPKALSGEKTAPTMTPVEDGVISGSDASVDEKELKKPQQSVV